MFLLASVSMFTKSFLTNSNYWPWWESGQLLKTRQIVDLRHNYRKSHSLSSCFFYLLAFSLESSFLSFWPCSGNRAAPQMETSDVGCCCGCHRCHTHVTSDYSLYHFPPCRKALSLSGMIWMNRRRARVTAGRQTSRRCLQNASSTSCGIASPTTDWSSEWC